MDKKNAPPTGKSKEKTLQGWLQIWLTKTSVQHPTPTPSNIQIHTTSAEHSEKQP